MGFKLNLIALMLVLAMVARTSAKVHDASWGFSRFGDHDDESLIDNANFVGDENEMTMESESTRRTLRPRLTARTALGNSKFIGYIALRENAAPCGRCGQSYYDCQKRERANPYKRNCEYITRCTKR
ncbi:protein RALF-like 19 [Pyrus x bretschneideri]|uniref:protein RALF-like 19 n=1 Tax=Pyrus x bretschneideri TaxID=225117 RepID=UPI00202E34F9|nr:protein RALF-like 19 [Pyrus x bretschneideri]